MPISINTLSNAWKVGSSSIYTPSINVRYEHTNVAGESSGRTEDGLLHIDWVRRDVRKVHLTYSAMTESELNYMLGLMQGQEFTFTFPDRGSSVTMDAYCGECNYTMHSQNIGGETIYTDVSINVIEI